MVGFIFEGYRHWIDGSVVQNDTMDERRIRDAGVEKQSSVGGVEGVLGQRLGCRTTYEEVAMKRTH